MYYVGIDPGHTTGYAVVQDDARVGPGVVFTAEIPWEDAYNIIATYLKEVRVHRPIVAVEDFIGGGRRTAYAHEALKVHGFAVGYATILGLEASVQAPQMRLPFIADAWTWWRSTAAVQVPAPKRPSKHNIDAMAHALACRWRANNGGPKEVSPVHAREAV
jgi:hypothetical protein